MCLRRITTTNAVTSSTTITPETVVQTQTAYDRNSNLTSILRKGLTGEENLRMIGVPSPWNTVDSLTLTYDGNRLTKVTDTATGRDVNAMDFSDGADKAVEYGYDADGRLTRDDNRGLKALKWTTAGLLSAVNLADGRQIAYATDGAGRRHRVRLQRPAKRPVLSDSGFVRPWKLPPLIELDTMTMVTDTVIAERRYIGSTQWQDSVLTRISTPTGYWDGSGRYHIAVRDFQGNIPAVIRLNADGTRQVVQQTHYYPYGATAANPLRFIDPGGERVIADEVCQDLIIKGLTLEEASYVSFNNGELDSDLLNSSISLSSNFTELKTLANSDMIYSIHSASEYIRDDENTVRQMAQIGIPGTRGVTLMPRRISTAFGVIYQENDYSTDGNVHIYISNKIHYADQVTNLAHELYGHGYLYELNQINKSFDPRHNYHGVVQDAWDEDSQTIVPSCVRVEGNFLLEKFIEKSTEQVRNNYHKYWNQW